MTLNKRRTLALLLLHVIVASNSFAQESNSDSNNLLVKLAQAAKKSVVQIHEAENMVCMGTVVSHTGLVVTKASELSDDKFQILFQSGTRGMATKIATSQQLDLALLEIESDARLINELQPIAFPKQFPRLYAGKFVVCMNGEVDNPRVGIVTIEVGQSSLQASDAPADFQFGITCYPNNDQAKTSDRERLQVKSVEPRSLAERSGILAGDTLQTINGRPIISTTDLDKVASTLRPGDDVRFEIIRSQDAMELHASISRFSKRLDLDRWGGGPFSRRRFGFSDVIVHDIALHPTECGSPLVDLQGQVVGINIARSLRVATLAIPLMQVKEFVLEKRPDARLLTD